MVPPILIDMTSGNDTSAAAAVLDRARGFRRDADMAEAHLLAEVLAWAELHVTSDPDGAETWGDTPVLLGGEGCPWIREFTITELASALHLSLPAGRALVVEVLELAFRLPRLWAKVQSGRVQSWRARRIARLTAHLSMEAAGFVDAQVAGFAHRMGQAAVERLVEEAIGRHMPDLAKRQRERAADRRHFRIDHGQVSFEGTCLVEGEIDLADALDLDAALGHIAGKMGALGNPLPLDQRRALAAGELARGQYSFFHDFDRAAPEVVEPVLVSQRTPSRVPTETTEATEPADTSTTVAEVAVANPGPGRFGRRDLTLYAHLSADTLTRTAQTADTEAGAGSPTNPETNPETVVTLESHDNPLVTLGTLREWLHITGNVNVTIRPVIDLNANLTSRGRFAPPVLREQVGLRDRTCAAPYCTRPARHLDLDHLDPWTDPDTGSPPDGPPSEPNTTDPPRKRNSQTRSDNLAALCRHHHRAKTLTGWCYEMLTPGVFYWTSPHGLRFLTFAGQTIDLN